MTQRSPTSNGCITNTNMMASNTVLHVLPNINATSKSCDEMKTSTLVVANPIKSNHTIIITISITPEAILFSSSIAVLVSFKECASDLRSR